MITTSYSGRRLREAEEGDASQAYGQCGPAPIVNVIDVTSLHCSFLATGSAPTYFSDPGDTCAMSMWPSHWRWNREILKTDDSVPQDLLGHFSLPGWLQLVLRFRIPGKIAFGAPNPRPLPKGGSCAGE